MFFLQSRCWDYSKIDKHAETRMRLTANKFLAHTQISLHTLSLEAERHNWQPLLFGSASPTLQLNSVTPSVHWVLFIWCCLTSAWEEFTLALLRWSTQCFKGLPMNRGSKPEQYYRERGKGVKVVSVYISRAGSCLPRCDSRVRTVLSTCGSGGVRLRQPFLRIRIRCFPWG